MKVTQMKKRWIFLPATAVLLFYAVSLFMTSCNKDAKVDPIGNNISTGTDVIDIPSATWVLDKVHSNTGWETLYFGANSMLTGRFNNFNTVLHFDQAHPENTVIHSWVQLSTFNTGETGRDNPGKCGPNYMGVVWDVDTVPNPDVYTVHTNTDTAWFASTSTEKYGTGYLSHGNLTFHGNTKPVDLYFSYSGITEYPSSTGGASAYKLGFAGQFDMNALSDFGVTSTSIADKVTVKINYNCKKL